MKIIEILLTVCFVHLSQSVLVERRLQIASLSEVTGAFPTKDVYTIDSKGPNQEVVNAKINGKPEHLATLHLSNEGETQSIQITQYGIDKLSDKHQIFKRSILKDEAAKDVAKEIE